MANPVRRVVVTLGAEGRSKIAQDAPSPHVHTLEGMPDALALTDLWYTGPESGSGDGAARPFAIAPDPSGSLFRVVEFPPDDQLPRQQDGAPALLWHATATVDYSVVLAGQLVFVCDEGQVALAQGDTIVVEGGNHAWSNPGPRSARLATVAVARPT